MNLEGRIASVPELRGLSLSWQPLGGGLTNTSVLVDTGTDQLVLRLNAPAPGVDREREARILEALAGSEMIPEVIAVEPESGYLLTRYLEEPTWQAHHAEDPQRLSDLAGCLRRLHEYRIEGDALAPEQLLRAYLEEPPVHALPGYDAIKTTVTSLISELAAGTYYDRAPVICHNDLAAGNILGAVRPVLIDWEFAGAGNPMLDLATFIHYHDLDPDRAEPLLDAYFGGHYGQYREELQLALRLAQAFELLWLACRADRDAIPEETASRLRRLLLVWG